MRIPGQRPAGISSVPIVLIGSLLTACGGEAEPEVIAPPVDPRFASAEALVDYCNSLTAREPIDFAALYDTFYGETELQRRFITASRAFLPMLDLMRQVETRFGESLGQSTAELDEMTSQGPARIVEHTGQRALAAYDDPTASTMYLVLVGDRWWVSGYTFEYDPAAPEFQELLPAMEAMADIFQQLSTDLSQRLNQGEFESIDEFRQGLAGAIIIAALKYPEQFQMLGDLPVTDNPFSGFFDEY